MANETRTVVVELIEFDEAYESYGPDGPHEPYGAAEPAGPVEPEGPNEPDELDIRDEPGPMSEAASACRTAAVVAPAPPDPDYFVG